MEVVRRLFLLALLVFLVTPVHRADTRTSLSHLPLFTVWAWQRPERLEFLDPKQVAVAYLDQTLYVRESVRSDPRAQPLHVSPGAQLIAVVRIEMPPGLGSESEENERSIVAALLRSARRPGISALQIDFDAVRSQRALYRRMIFDVRRQMPRHMPLSITALASWCAFDDWIHDLPVDEAVPMFFRMGMERALFDRRGPAAAIREPLCSGSLGLSTDEPWPEQIGRKRLYVFHTRSWTSEAWTRTLARVNP